MTQNKQPHMVVVGADFGGLLAIRAAVTADTPFKPYPAELPPASPEATKNITLEI